MGIKGWLLTGLGVVATVVLVIRHLQKEDQSEKKVRQIIREVDCKGKDEKEETESIEQMSSELVEAMKDMGLDKEAEAYVNAMNAVNDCLANEIKEQTGKSPDEILKDVKLENGESGKDWLDRNFKEMEEKANLEAIRLAVESEDFTQMSNLFDQRYNKYPTQMARASAFASAKAEGLISDELLQKAKDFYGNLWSYVGD